MLLVKERKYWVQGFYLALHFYKINLNLNADSFGAVSVRNYLFILEIHNPITDELIK